MGFDISKSSSKTILILVPNPANLTISYISESTVSSSIVPGTLYISPLRIFLRIHLIIFPLRVLGNLSTIKHFLKTATGPIS